MIEIQTTTPAHPGVRLTVIALAAFIAAALTAACVILFIRVDGQAAQVSRLDSQLSVAHKTTTSQEHEISSLQGSVATLLGQVANPSDPLGAYTDICNQDFTNNSTGIDQTYYFPCTNQAQTMPLPGN